VAGLVLSQATTSADIALARALFLEYQAELGISLCFQGFDAELAALPGSYVPPQGRLLIARVGDAVAGCGALRPLPGEFGEMKRVFVRPGMRGHGAGLAICEALVAAARQAGYAKLRLDTLPSMHAAQSLYARLGFVDTASHTDNPVEGARFMELTL
jgi:ribosomal protein S18 acetylase RimI-like enzyme